MSESPEEIGATTEENTNPRNAGAKRKRLATGTVSTTRSVANLTPDQLEKKRKNDREVCLILALFMSCGVAGLVLVALDNQADGCRRNVLLESARKLILTG